MDCQDWTAARRAATAVALAGILFALVARAAPLGAPARAEIEALLERLGSSNCEFFRNDEWRPAADARAHLETKLRYLEKRGLVESAEQFIERAGTDSSVSGRPYRVRCAGAAPVDSAVWLTGQLKALRAGPVPRR